MNALVFGLQKTSDDYCCNAKIVLKFAMTKEVYSFTASVLAAALYSDYFYNILLLYSIGL